MNKRSIISSAVRSVANNPQLHSDSGFDCVSEMLKQYRNGELGSDELSGILQQGPFNRTFVLSDNDIQRIMPGILVLHHDYLPCVSQQLQDAIKDRTPEIIEQTVWQSAEAAKTVINGRVIDEPCQSMKSQLWSCVLGCELDVASTPFMNDEKMRLDFFIPRIEKIISDRLKRREDFRTSAAMGFESD